MKIIHDISTLKTELSVQREKGARVGFVPTMGALHQGHLSLMHKCISSCDFSIASIYVNPTQFNDKNDFQRYPRNMEQDYGLLRQACCDVVFVPSDTEMYPEPDQRNFDFGIMGEIMEGKFRPGHFNGVAQIVTRLFDAVEPDAAFFGQKDFQQLAIIRKLVTDLHYPITIVACPIVREPDGLAMSSRNVLLSVEERRSAPVIYQTLTEVKELIGHTAVTEIEEHVKSRINSSSRLKLEYFQIVHSCSLEPVSEFMPYIPVTACIAVYAGNVRLIDNIELIS